MLGTIYRTDDEKLNWFLEAAAAGRLQLPDFQRDWVWDDSHIRSLLASISLSYPVGTVMMLETGGEAEFKQRTLDGAPSPKRDAEWLILDGQQRLTALLQSLLSDEPVETRNQGRRGKKIKRWYYIDMQDALNKDMDRAEAVLSVPEDKLVKTKGTITADYSTPEKEYEAMVFPLSKTFSASTWGRGYVDYWRSKGIDIVEKRWDTWEEFNKNIVKAFEDYKISLIELAKETPGEAVCQVFEKVNSTGVTLNVFELLTAMFAAKGFDLRDDWKDRRKRLAEYRVLKSVSSTAFLQAVTLLATWERQAIGCKRADMLRLTLDEYKQWAEPLMAGFRRAAFFLQSEHVFDAKFLPYGSQLIPLAAIQTVLEKDEMTDGERIKLAQWYWCGVFGELYGGTPATRFTHDLPEVVEWMRDGETIPQTVNRALFRHDRLLSLNDLGQAAYKGMYSLILREGARDWRTGNKIADYDQFEKAVHGHHIFPRAWCEQNNVDEERRESIVNRTPISAKTNQMIGRQAPSEYTVKIQSEDQAITKDQLNSHLRSHCIDPDLLRRDEFEDFFMTRYAEMISRIEKAMGKRVVDIPEDDDEVVDEEPPQMIPDEDE